MPPDPGGEYGKGQGVRPSCCIPRCSAESGADWHCLPPTQPAPLLPNPPPVTAHALPADSDSEESEAGGEGAAGSSSDDENADSNSRRRMQGASSSQDDQAAGPRGQHQQEAGSHSQDTLPRAASAAGCHSPPHLPPHLQQQQPGRPPGAAFASPPRLQPAGSDAGPAGSSSYLPDAPPDSALEDTATAGGPRRHQDPGREGGAAPPFPGPAGNRFAWPSLQQQEQQQQSERGGDDGALQRMRMLSLEAEGSAQQGQSAGDADEDGPQDMIRSPAPVTSRPMAPRLPPLPMGDSQSLLEIRGSQQQEQAPQGRAGHGSGGGTRRTAAAAAGARMAAVFEEAAKLALTGRPEQQQQQQQQGQQAQEQEQESSEGHSTGQASSAAHEAPKRQRRSGDLLPPLFEHSSRQQQQQQQQQQPHQRTASGGAAATDQAAAADREISSRAAAAARRAAILGSLRPRERAEHLGPQQQRAQDLVPEGPQQGEGPDVGGSGTGAGRAAHPDRQQQPPPLQQQQDGQQHEDEAEGGPPGEPSDAALRGPRAAHSGSSVWGSTLVCADLTVNDVASQYWPFLRSAMRGQVRAVPRVPVHRAGPALAPPCRPHAPPHGAAAAALRACRHAGRRWRSCQRPHGPPPPPNQPTTHTHTRTHARMHAHTHSYLHSCRAPPFWPHCPASCRRLRCRRGTRLSWRLWWPCLGRPFPASAAGLGIIGLPS